MVEEDRRTTRKSTMLWSTDQSWKSELDHSPIENRHFPGPPTLRQNLG